MADQDTVRLLRYRPPTDKDPQWLADAVSWGGVTVLFMRKKNSDLMPIKVATCQDEAEAVRRIHAQFGTQKYRGSFEKQKHSYNSFRKHEEPAFDSLYGAKGKTSLASLLTHETAFQKAVREQDKRDAEKRAVAAREAERRRHLMYDDDALAGIF